MRTLDTAFADAAGAEALKERVLAWITATDRDTGDPVSLGLWNDLKTLDIPVIDALTQSEVTRTFYGAGAALVVGALSQTSDLTVRELDLGLSQIDATVENLVRGYDIKQAPVQVYRGLFDPQTHRLVSAAVPRFVGFVDTVEIKTPKEGEFGAISLKCVSQLREMTRGNPDVRSGASQRARSAGDSFYDDVQSKFNIFWGQTKGKAA